MCAILFYNDVMIVNIRNGLSNQYLSRVLRLIVRILTFIDQYLKNSKLYDQGYKNLIGSHSLLKCRFRSQGKINKFTIVFQ